MVTIFDYSKPFLLFLLCQLWFLASQTQAQDSDSEEEELFIQAQVADSYNLSKDNISLRLKPLGFGLMGDKIDPFTGSLSLSITDVSVPGNSNLEVAFRRKTGAISDTKLPQDLEDMNILPLGDWVLDVPFISYMDIREEERAKLNFGNQNSQEKFGRLFDASCFGKNFLDKYDWIIRDRRKNKSYSEAAIQGGVFFNNPGKGSEHILKHFIDFGSANGKAKTNYIHEPEFDDDDVIGITKRYSKLSCEDNVLVVSVTDGSRFKFNKKVFRPAVYVRSYGIPNFERQQVLILATEVTDPHGNWVKYDYDTFGRLRKIHSNDGREILIKYDAFLKQQISKVEVNGREWIYQYNDGNLIKVTQPDGASWEYNISSFSRSTYGLGAYTSRRWSQRWPEPLALKFEGDTLVDRDVSFEDPITIKHPYGVVASYVLHEKSSGLTSFEDESRPNNVVIYEKEHRNLAVVGKRLSGLGIPTSTWLYNYENIDRNREINRLRTITEVAPSGKFIEKKYFYAGKLRGELASEIVKDEETGAVLQSTDFVFDESSEPNYIGELESIIGSLGWKSNLSVIFPLKKTITRGADIYTTEYKYNTNIYSSEFSYSKPTKITTYSSLNPARKETHLEYTHQKDKWVLGLTDKVFRNGKEIVDYDYDDKGRIDEIKSSVGSIQSQTIGYHSTAGQAGAIAWVKDALNRETRYLDYKRGIPQLMEMNDGTTYTRGVDDNGWLNWVRNPRDYETAYEYNAMGWLKNIDQPGNVPDTVINYFDIGGASPRQEITRGNYRETLWYDALHRVIQENKKDLNDQSITQFVNYEFDEAGRSIFTSLVSDAPGSKYGTRTKYDGLGRVTETTVGSETSVTSRTSMNYMGGHRVDITDPRSNTYTHLYSAYGDPDKAKLAEVIYPGLSKTLIEYDVFGNRTSVTQEDLGEFGNQSTQLFYYDDKLRLCRHSVPETGDSLFAYDDANQLTGKLQGQPAGNGCSSAPYDLNNPARSSYEYDDMGRLSATKHPGEPAIRNTYYKDGNVWSVEVDNGPLTVYGYNANDQLSLEVSRVDGKIRTTFYQYENTYLSQMQTVSGRTIKYAPDALGRPTKVAEGAKNFVDDMRYFPNGQMKEANYHNGTRYTSSQDAKSRLNRLQVGKGSESIINLVHFYNEDDSINKIWNDFDTDEDRYMLYDPMGRLTAVSGPWGSESFVYDGLGNIREKESFGESLTMNYDSKNRLSSFVGSSQPQVTVGYDTRGNITNNGRFTLGYNHNNQPVSVNGSVNGEFVYTGNKRRVKQTINGETIYTMYSKTGAVLYRENVTKGESTEYIPANGKTAIRIKNGVATYVHKDHLGSPVAATDENGNVLWRERYTAFGKKRINPNANKNDQAYTGHIHDDSLGLTYMQARFYDPMLGRFYSNDPVDFAGHLNRGNSINGFNRYAYANNNPYTYVDPDGEFGILATGLIGAIAGAAVNSVVYAATTENFSFSTLGAKALTGAAVGGFTGLGMGAAAAAVASGATTAAVGTAGSTTIAAGAGAVGAIVNNGIDGKGSTIQNVAGGAVANVVGTNAGHAIGPIANLLSTTTTPAIKGLTVSSLAGNTFSHGGQPAIQTTNAIMSGLLQDLSGELVSSAINEGLSEDEEETENDG